MKKKILFVCLGNICRSPMAEGIMLDLIKKAGLEDKYEIDSAGTAGYHTGELPDSRMRKHALQRGYNLMHHSRKVTTDDFYDFDLIIGMDDNNIADLTHMAPSPWEQRKIQRMTDYCTGYKADCIPDPYYGGSSGFDFVIDLLEDACAGLMKDLEEG